MVLVRAWFGFGLLTLQEDSGKAHWRDTVTQNMKGDRRRLVIEKKVTIHVFGSKQVLAGKPLWWVVGTKNNNKHAGSRFLDLQNGTSGFVLLGHVLR